MMRNKTLLQFEPTDWLEEAAEAETVAGTLKAYDRWRIARADYLNANSDQKPSPMVAESWAESCELQRAMARLEAMP
jgi:hypothetical protein